MSSEELVEDGFGSTWSKCSHPLCDLQVVRPGKSQCSNWCNFITSEQDEQHKALIHHVKLIESTSEKQEAWLDKQLEFLENQNTELKKVLDNLELAVRMADYELCVFIGFVWSQRSEYILKGEETWNDQKIRDPQFGGPNHEKN
jgi:hypothetical protein